MIEQDTVKLLRECDAGVKMGVSSIDDVLKYVYSPDLKNFLVDSKQKHNELDSEIQQELDRFKDEGKEPNPIAKSNMGVKSLNMYLNKYEAADEKSKEITKKLIDLEEKLAIDIRRFL